MLDCDELMHIRSPAVSSDQRVGAAVPSPDGNAVPVSFTGGSAPLGTPALLFRATLNTNQRRPLAMSPDGQRFLEILEGPQEASAATLVTNFARDLK